MAPKRRRKRAVSGWLRLCLVRVRVRVRARVRARVS